MTSTIAPPSALPVGAGPLDRAGRLFLAGHRGLVGSALHRLLTANGFEDVVTRSSAELDLRDQAAVERYFREQQPRYVVLAAAKVGGIAANDAAPAEFFADNVRIQVNVMDAARRYGVERLLFLGSSCIYPKHARQPITEDALLTGPLEPTNDAYAIAKIAGMIHLRSIRREYGLPWISAMPTNIYGPGDNFSLTSSHVLPALVRRFDDAVRAGDTVVTNWGTGLARREFLHADDLASASLYLLDSYDGDQHVNVGTGRDVSIRELADTVADVVGYRGAIEWDSARPDGTPRKVLDVSLLERLGWRPLIGLREGIEQTVEWYRAHHARARR